MALLEAAKSTTTRRQSETKQMAEKTPSRRTRSTWSKEHPVVISDSDEHAHTQQPAMPCHRSRKVAMKSQARSKKTIRDQSPQRPVHYPRDKTATASPRSPIGESPLLADSPYLVDRNEFYVDLCPEQELERPESLLSRESTESQGLEPLDVSLEELAHLEPPLLEHLESQGLEYLESKSMSQEPQFRLEERLSPRGLATMSNVDWRGVDDEEEGESPISYVCLPACVSDAVDLPWVEGLLELDQAQVLQKIGLTEVPNRTIVHAILITWLRDENAAKDLALCTLSDLMSVCTRIVEQAYRENDMAAKRIRLPKSIIWSVPALPGGGAFIATNLDKRPERFGVHQCGVMEAYQAACVYSRTRTAECGSGRQSLVKYVTRRKRHSSFYGVFWDYKKQAWFSTWARISDKKKVTNHFYLTSASDDEMCRQNARDDRWRAEGEGECHPRNRQALLTRPDEFLSTCDT
ncbi:MAG: hypothetical protein KVP17_002772 [Porospora cf. gigantea B]|nr:MAG: hypothetical protein KVP17_002772 [Porospora cf. gigantea B]